MKPKHQMNYYSQALSCQIVTFAINQLDLKPSLPIGLLDSWEWMTDDFSLLQGNLAEMKLIIQEYNRYDSGELCWQHSNQGTTEWQCKFWWTNIHLSSYNTISLKCKLLDMICLLVFWWVMMHCKLQYGIITKFLYIL